MAKIDPIFEVEKKDGEWFVTARGREGLVVIAKGKEWLFAEILASRLNAEFQDSCEEMNYLLESIKAEA